MIRYILLRRDRVRDLRMDLSVMDPDLNVLSGMYLVNGCHRFILRGNITKALHKFRSRTQAMKLRDRMVELKKMLRDMDE